MHKRTGPFEFYIVSHIFIYPNVFLFRYSTNTLFARANVLLANQLALAI